MIIFDGKNYPQGCGDYYYFGDFYDVNGFGNWGYYGIFGSYLYENGLGKFSGVFGRGESLTSIDYKEHFKK